MPYKHVVLIVTDGVGLALDKEGNAVAQTNKPNWAEISRTYPGTALHASGIEVGLPWGEVGSSQVGHTNIGAGLVVYQNLPRINMAIESGAFYTMPIWKDVIAHTERNNSAIHIMGMVSSGGVHSHIDHLKALLDMLAKHKVKRPVYIHMFTDGQDVPPRTAPKFLADLEAHIKKTKMGKLATIMGKKYAMDRDKNWELIEKAYACMIEAKGDRVKNAREALENAYANHIEDAGIPPSVIDPEGVIREQDALIFFNYRPDRAREITETFFKKMPKLFFVTMTQYQEHYPVKIAFPPQNISSPLGKVISDAGKTQIRIAESEKQAHASYFFNGGVETQFPGENRYFLESLKMDSYVSTPEMSAFPLADAVCDSVKKGYDFVMVNFANGDMLGHTGNLEAGIKAVEVLDKVIKQVVDCALAAGGAVVLTADHGNCEEMTNLKTKEVDTEHSTNPVGLWVMTPDNKLPPAEVPMQINVQGALLDVAPTVLELFGLPKPPEMEGHSFAQMTTRQPI